MLGHLFDGLGRVFDAFLFPLLDLNLSNEVEVVPEPYPAAEGKPLTRSQAWSNFRKFLDCLIWLLLHLTCHIALNIVALLYIGLSSISCASLPILETMD